VTIAFSASGNAINSPGTNATIQLVALSNVSKNPGGRSAT